MNDSLFNLQMSSIQCIGLIDVEKYADFASSSAKAIAMVCATFEPDCPFYYSLIVMDYDMPCMNGPTTAKFVNELYDVASSDDGKYFVKPNIVCYTANCSEETLGKCLDSGMSAQFNKPFLIVELE